MRRARLDAELVRRGLARSREHAAELIAAGSGHRLGAGRDQVGDGRRPGCAAAGPRRRHRRELGVTRRAQADRCAGRLHRRRRRAAVGAWMPERPPAASPMCCCAAARARWWPSTWVMASSSGGCRPTSGSSCTTGRTSATLTPEAIGGPAELIVADLSFISLTLVLPALTACATADADLVPMVKPQFEVGRDRLGAGGVVRDLGHRADAVTAVVRAAGLLGWGLVGIAPPRCPVPAAMSSSSSTLGATRPVTRCRGPHARRHRRGRREGAP